jgi:hypothetical protein
MFASRFARAPIRAEHILQPGHRHVPYAPQHILDKASNAIER